MTGYPLGVNVVGAMAGGLLEYVSMAVGMRAVWLAVPGVYGLAWLATELSGRRALEARPRPRPGTSRTLARYTLP